MTVQDQIKALIALLRASLCGCASARVRQVIMQLFARDAKTQPGHPCDTRAGPAESWGRVYARAPAMMSGLERREFIGMAGPLWGAGQSGNWVGLSVNSTHLKDAVMFGDHDRVAIAGWPFGTATPFCDAVLGSPPTRLRITWCSLGFLRMEEGARICKHWVMADRLDRCRQLGVDVFARIPGVTGVEVAA